MATRRKSKKYLVTQLKPKKQKQSSIAKPSVNKPLMESSRNSVVKPNVTNSRKRKAVVLDGNENHNEKRYSKRARVSIINNNTSKRSLNNSVKVTLKLASKVRPSKTGKRLSKVKAIPLTDRKLKEAASMKQETAGNKKLKLKAVSIRKKDAIDKKIKKASAPAKNRNVTLKTNPTSRSQSKKKSKKITITKISTVLKKNRSIKKIVRVGTTGKKASLKKVKNQKTLSISKKDKPIKKVVLADAIGGGTLLKKKRSTKKALEPKDFVTDYAKDPTFESNEFIPHVSTIAHSRLLIRAVILNDMKMLKNLIHDKKSICSFTIPRSLNINRDAFSYALEMRNMEAIKMLVDSKLSENLAVFPDVILSDERTGYNSTMMFGHALRTVTVGRGGKEGNNALLKDRNIYCKDQRSVNFTNDMAKESLSFGLPKALIQKMGELMPDIQSNIYNNFFNGIVFAIRNGHNQLAGELVEEAITRGGYGFNLLHKEVLLNTDKPLTAFKSVSVVKKVTFNDRITPLHCAAINPNPVYLTALLNSRPDYSIIDTQNWSVIHYASVCTGTGPLQMLIARGISTLQANKDGDTPLHLASALGRVENVKLILKTQEANDDEDEVDTPKDISGSLVQRVNKVGQTALHRAAVAGHSDIISILLTAGADPNKFTPARYDKLTPFMLAARHGHLEVLKVFVQHGIKVDTVDHKGRSALAHAIINGQAHVVSYILRMGANNLKKDSSGNTLVHYAAAYGWYFCLKLLKEAGCPLNEPNDWKMTPLAISFMKGHMGLVEYILKQPGVDINSRINDSTGVTLLLQTLSSQPTTDFLSRLKFLLLNQKADCNIADFEGNNAFHYLVETEYREMSKDSNYNNSETQQIVVQATRLLWDHECNPCAKNCNKGTSISLAIQYGCFSILNNLLDLISVLPEEPNKKRNTLLHIMVSQAHSKEATVICKRWAQDSTKLDMLKRMADTYNKSGYTPLLWLLHRAGIVAHNHLVKNITEFMDFLVNTLKSDVAAFDREEKSGQSVTHLASNVSYPEEALNIILPMRPSLEVFNYYGQTPLTCAIVNGKETAAKVLLNAGANINAQMTNINSLLLQHALTQNQSFHLIPLMIEKGANIHEVNKHTKNSILHYICRKPHLPYAVESVRILVEKKINVDAVNKDGRTALHLAVNFRAGETDASYEIEDLLIESKAKLNIRDNRGRIALHMAFVKIGKHADGSFMDPIELTTTLVRGMKQSQPNFANEIRLADEFGYTPLHYAAYRGSTISCSYLLMEMSDNVDIHDKNGNTPFGLAVLNGHEGCALQFQQKGANFLQNLNTNLSRIAANEGLTTPSWQWIHVKKMKEENDRKKLEKENYPILQEVVRKDWQGILHLMLEKLNNSGVGASLAIAAAINTNRLKLTRKLVNRARSSELLINEDRETLLHILAKSDTKQDINRDTCEQIVNTLKSKGISNTELDKNESTALILAAANRNLIVCNLLQETSVWINKADKFGRTPFSALFWNINEKTDFSSELKKWAESLLEQGALGNVCSQYPVIVHPFPGVRCLNCETTTNVSSTKYTPLIMAVIAGNYSIVKWLLTMRKADVIDVNYQDDEGRTALMHAARLNDIKMVRLLTNPTTYDYTKDAYSTQDKPSTQNKNHLNFRVKDKKGWTVMDHVVAVHEGDSYYATSDAIIISLHSAGAKINERSGDGISPLERAIKMKRFHLVTCMEELLALPQAQRTTFAIDYSELFNIDVDENLLCYSLITNYNNDCQSAIESIMDTDDDDDENEDKNLVDPDEVMSENNNEKYKVIYDPEQQVHFNCCLTKVDISYGTWGIYNFYKMQLLKQERGKELIVLFTRWGRVGDEGQFQKTPFPSEEEAVKEFKKIFRLKTGNLWDNLGTFAPIPKKYRLVELQKKRFEKLNKVKINFDKFQKTKNLKPTSLPPLLVKLIENLSMVHKNNVKFAEFDEEFESRLTFETLKKGAHILEQIEELIKKRDELKTKEQFSADNELNFMESVLKPSEEFYGLIPVYGFSNDKLKPMFTMDDLREKQKVINKLIHLEFASQLLIAAEYNINNINPFEYIFRCLNTKVEALVEEGDEAQLILQYIHNTSTHPECSTNPPKIIRIFRLERSEEIERMRECNFTNKHLLWHGTDSVNVLSILHRGLQVTPLEANLSGHLFGKGIYFSDMFMKSQKYSHGTGPKVMFLCEVALGTIHPIKLHYWEATSNNPLPSNCHSLKTVDSKWEPDCASTVIFRGCSVPLGRAKENVLPENQYHGLDHNEFVVFRDDQVKLRYLIQFED